MGDITQIIEQGNAADGVDSAALFNAAYGELRKLAHARLSRNGPLTLLDSTVLVNEIWLRLADQKTLRVDTRRRFFAYAAQVMRSIIVDQVRERSPSTRRWVTGCRATTRPCRCTKPLSRWPSLSRAWRRWWRCVSSAA